MTIPHEGFADLPALDQVMIVRERMLRLLEEEEIRNKIIATIGPILDDMQHQIDALNRAVVRLDVGGPAAGAAAAIPDEADEADEVEESLDDQLRDFRRGVPQQAAGANPKDGDDDIPLATQKKWRTNP